MAPADSAKRLASRRVPLKRKVVLKFHDFGGFFVEYSANISQTGIFIRTREPRAPGSVFIFEIWLGEEYKLVHGIGEVVWTRRIAEAEDRPAGMGVRFLKISDESREVIRQVVEQQVEEGGEVFDLETSGDGVAETLRRIPSDAETGVFDLNELMPALPAEARAAAESFGGAALEMPDLEEPAMGGVVAEAAAHKASSGAWIPWAVAILAIAGGLLAYLLY